MAEMSMIERVAREAELEHHCGRTPPAPDSWKSWIPVVRAVLLAIRDPSDAVLKAMRDTVPVDGFEWDYVEEDAVPHWQAMIDAALAEEG